jgi:hypothetical protein
MLAFRFQSTMLNHQGHLTPADTDWTLRHARALRTIRDQLERIAGELRALDCEWAEWCVVMARAEVMQSLKELEH